ncbi:unnamed protein product [Rotaria socialis]|uniref:Uncharacterized protein n=1 Tax=Rotaria socialis TaxID=392032 RepID=A0A818SXL3_9BILA|nr:unnamed protein product [Rotaria socialis]CAF4834175.1 unnamed protein product [Rotaria socialis]
MDIVSIHRENSYKFIEDISHRATALLTNPYFVKNVGARICARVFGENKFINNDIEEFTYSAITSLRTGLKLNGLVSFDSCMESNIELNPREIHINGEWNYHALKASLDDPTQYRLHVLLGTIKLLHEFFHCLTPSFINYRNQHEPDLKPLTETPPDMGRKVVIRVSTKRGQKSTRFIGDMGFAMEEVLFGGQRLFHIPRQDDFHYSIEKLYLQEYDMKTLKPINYDVNVDLMWTMFAVPDQLFVIQDLDRFHNLKVELKPSPSKSLSSPRKRSSITRNTASPTKFSRQILESSSVGELFSTSSDDDSADDEVENQLSSLPLPAGRKT